MCDPLMYVRHQTLLIPKPGNQERSCRLRGDSGATSKCELHLALPSFVFLAASPNCKYSATLLQNKRLHEHNRSMACMTVSALRGSAASLHATYISASIAAQTYAGHDELLLEAEIWSTRCKSTRCVAQGSRQCARGNRRTSGRPGEQRRCAETHKQFYRRGMWLHYARTRHWETLCTVSRTSCTFYCRITGIALCAQA